MLFLHDVHMVMGEREFDFEDAVRNEYAPAVAEDGARLLWYLHATHGSGEAYKMITLTAVRDGATWERLAERLRYGDLAGWQTEVDAMCYGATSALLVGAPWSPLGELDLESVPGRLEAERPEVVFREDTLFGAGIADMLDPSGGEAGVLECVAGFVPVFGGSSAKVLYRLAPSDRWTPEFDADAGWGDWSGSLTPTLPDGVDQSMQMLRAATWSPLS